MRRCLLLWCAMLAAGCTQPDPSHEGGAFLRIADTDDVPTLDPARGYDTASWQIEDMLFSTLVDYDNEGRLVPELAASWSASDDGLTYTFYLRPDVRFSSGRAVEADDIRFSIERVLSAPAKSPGAEFFRGLVGAEHCAATCRVDGIETPDAHTVRFRLREVDLLFLHKLAMPFAAAVPAEEVARWGEDFSRHPVGSGPFMLQEWTLGQRLILKRNPTYFLPDVPRLAGVVRFVGVNDDLAWLKYEAGQLDVSVIPPPEFPRVIKDAAYQPFLRSVTTLRTQYLGMNCQQAPFSDVRVRRALNHAVDKTKLLRLINNRGVVAKGFVPPHMPGYESAVPGYAFDPPRARQLLAEAGYPHGFASTLWVRNDDTVLRLAQSIQQDLAEVQVAVEIKAVAWGTFLEAVKSPDLIPIFLLGWEADFPDASNFLEVLLHSKYIGTNNNTNYRSATVDALLDTAAQTADPETRRGLLQRVEQQAFEDAPWVFLYHPVTYEIVSPRVRDFRLHPLRPARFDQVWLADGATAADTKAP